MIDNGEGYSIFTATQPASVLGQGHDESRR